MDEVYRSPWFDLEGYRACTVKYADGSKGTILEHREVMEKKLGRGLGSGEIVHHKDRDRRNNRSDNLELKTVSGHARDHRAEHPAEVVTVTCILCGREVQKLARYVRHNRKQGKTGPFCGKKCAGRWSHHGRVLE